MSTSVLVIDDSPEILRTAASILGEAGHEVRTAADGQEGMAQVRAQRPDLVLVASTMPSMNGHRFCNELEKELGPARPPVLVMATKAELDRQSFVGTPAVVDCISKPFSPEALVAVVTHTIEKRAARSSVFAQDTPPEPAPASEPEQASAFEAKPTTEDRPHALQPPTDETSGARRLGAAAVDDEEVTGSGARRQSLRVALSSALAVNLERRGVSDYPQAALAAVDEALSRLPPDGAKPYLSDISLWCDLTKVPLPEVLQFLQYQDHTGLFHVWYRKTRYDIYLQRGRVVAARAENVAREYWLGRFLVARGLIGQSELDQLVRSSSGKGRLRLGEKLVRLGHISAAELKQVIADQCCELVYEALRARHGTCCFVAGVTAPPEFDQVRVDIGVQELLLEGLRRVDEWNVIEREVSSFDAVFAPRLESRGGFTAEERRLLQLVDGERTVRDLVSAAKMRPFEACRLLYRLAATRKIVKAPAD